VNLEVRDPVLVAVAQRTAAGTPGVARLHGAPWRAAALVRARGRGVEVDRNGGGGPVLTVRLVVRRGRTVLEVVRTVQRSVRDELLRLTGLAPEVVVVVVDLE
jgi:uncharacterized alkaline shock family protein YloU